MPSSAPIAVLAALIALAPAGGVAHAEDRYGPPPPADASTAPPLTLLTWPGKIAAAEPAAVPAAPPVAAPVAAQAASRDLPASLYAPARTAYAPQPIPAPPPPQAAARRDQVAAGSTGEPPRYYSLHRQYGLQPDPISLSPQFLAATGDTDLAEPPPLPPPHTNAAQTANMSAAAAANQNRAAAEANQAADADAPN